MMILIMMMMMIMVIIIMKMIVILMIMMIITIKRKITLFTGTFTDFISVKCNTERKKVYYMSLETVQ